MGENRNRCIPNASTQVILLSQKDKACESVIWSALLMITLGKLGFAALTTYWYSATPCSLVVWQMELSAVAASVLSLLRCKNSETSSLAFLASVPGF